MTKSKDRKRRAGTLRRSRLRRGTNAAEVLAALPAAPVELNDAQRRTWERFGRLSLQIGALTEQDLPLLDLCARTWDSVTELELLLKADGLVIVSDSGARKAHPGLQALDRARGLVHRMLGDLGLSPPGREKISVSKPIGRNQFVD